MSNYLSPQQEPGCPTPNCENAAMGVYTNPHGYVCKKKKKTSRRLECNACRKGFSVKDKASAGQRKPHENKTIFKKIASKKPIREIAAMTKLSIKAVYDKIDFIYAQCLGFVGERTARAHRIRRKYIRLCVDRQDYMTNWRSRKARKIIQFTSICTVEGKTGYVLGHHLNYDPNINQVDVDDIAKASGDFDQRSRSYFHAQSHYWKSDEFYDVARKQATDIRPGLEDERWLVEQLIKETRKVESGWPKAEMADYPGRKNQLPPNGVMSHLDYTSYAHAILMRRLIGSPEYLSIYTDQDEVIRGAYISAFRAGIAMDRVDMAYVQFQKIMEIDEKPHLSNTCEGYLNALELACGCDREVAISVRWFGIKAPMADEIMKVVLVALSVIQRGRTATRIISKMIEHIEAFEENIGDMGSV